MIEDLPGRRCTSIRQFRHGIDGAEPSVPGPVEFGWNNDAYLTIDLATDWTLSLSSQPWSDPFAKAAAIQREELALHVGLWEEAPTSAALSRLVGQVLASVDPMLNEVGELAGLQLEFERATVVALVRDGEIAIEVLLQ